MASDKIRIGVIGANVSKGWAHRSHLPALMASPEFELTGVCTTHQETADEAKARFGARLAFHNHQDMLPSPEIDAVAVVVRMMVMVGVMSLSVRRRGVDNSAVEQRQTDDRRS